MPAQDFLAEDYNQVRLRRTQDLDRELGYDMLDYARAAGTPAHTAAVQSRQARYLRDRARLDADLTRGMEDRRYDPFYVQNQQRERDRAAMRPSPMSAAQSLQNQSYISPVRDEVARGQRAQNEDFIASTSLRFDQPQRRQFEAPTPMYRPGSVEEFVSQNPQWSQAGEQEKRRAAAIASSQRSSEDWLSRQSPSPPNGSRFIPNIGFIQG
jgi:hypothetical protein